LSPLLNFHSEYAIRKVKENHMGLELNGAYQFLEYTSDINVLGENVHAIKGTNKISCKLLRMLAYK
jgi:hypothetical protein